MLRFGDFSSVRSAHASPWGLVHCHMQQHMDFGFKALVRHEYLTALRAVARARYNYFDPVAVASGFLRTVTGEGRNDPTGPVNSSFVPSS